MSRELILTLLMIFSLKALGHEQPNCERSLNDAALRPNTRVILGDAVSVSLAIAVNTGSFLTLGTVPYWTPMLHPTNWSQPSQPKWRPVEVTLKAARIFSILMAAHFAYENRQWLSFWAQSWRITDTSVREFEATIDRSTRVNSQLEGWRQAYTLKNGHAPSEEEFLARQHQIEQILH